METQIRKGTLERGIFLESKPEIKTEKTNDEIKNLEKK
ncbi:hypothetical protein METP1_01811 [Methanosarcinales archaeon]|nr:hypothetical protein METP1_01811 [Methanosarcinales archaeon]